MGLKSDMNTLKSPIDLPRKEQVVTMVRQLIPSHQVWCEPYFHNGEVFFNKRRSPKEIINDRDHNIVNFYLMVRSRWKQLAFLMDSTLKSDFFVELADKIIEDPASDELRRAWAFWLKYNKAFIAPDKWNVNDIVVSREEYAEPVQKAMLESLSLRLKDVFLSSRAPLQVIQDADGPDTVFYINPPSKKELLVLLPILKDLKGKVILYTPEAGLIKKNMERLKLYTTEEWKAIGVYTNFKRQMDLFETAGT